MGKYILSNIGGILMLHYPLMVFIDTNVFISCKYNLNGNGYFSILKKFIKHFDMQIPQTYTLDDKKRKSILKYDKIDESDGIYPIGTLNWKEINIKKLILGKKSKNRDPKNLDKTKNLYPRIYEATKDMNISIRYSSNKKKISPIFQDMLL